MAQPPLLARRGDAQVSVLTTLAWPHHSILTRPCVAPSFQIACPHHSIVPSRLNAVVVGRSEPPAGSIVTAAAFSTPICGGTGSVNIAEPFASVLNISARTGFP